MTAGNFRNELLELLIRDEGFRSKPYRDTVGKLTIGIGRNLTDKGINKDEAVYLCGTDIREVERDLDMNLPWWRSLSVGRQMVLASMCFNMGWPVMSQFKNTIALVKMGEYEKAADAMLLSKWAGQVGKRANRLADMMRKG